nr:MAG TPA: hypothetical protein [Caudoviricetes sp.]
MTVCRIVICNCVLDAVQVLHEIYTGVVELSHQLLFFFMGCVCKDTEKCNKSYTNCKEEHPNFFEFLFAFIKKHHCDFIESNALVQCILLLLDFLCDFRIQEKASSLYHCCQNIPNNSTAHSSYTSCNECVPVFCWIVSKLINCRFELVKGI